MGRNLPTLLALAGTLAAGPAGAADDLGRWNAGAYSYSDERGGFSIVGISGTGTLEDPIVLVQELHSASPVTLVVRAIKPIRPRFMEGDFANGFIYLQLVTLNNSGLPWLEFEFELQEIEGEPSTFGDGLSFDQRKTDSDTISADLFTHYSRDYEPYDRLLFQDGHADPLETVSFRFLVTDFTPRCCYFIVQDPSIPAS
jgi:hypothetical protein